MHFRNLRNQKSANVKYFAPRFIKIRPGQTNTWVNGNNELHELVSGNSGMLSLSYKNHLKRLNQNGLKYGKSNFIIRLIR
jgi:plastocyanin